MPNCLICVYFCIYCIVATQNNKDINETNCIFLSNLQHEKTILNKYVWFGLQGFRQSAGNPGSPQGSPQHRGVEEDETLDGYPGLFFVDSYKLGEEKAFEVRTEPSSSFQGLSGEVLERQEPTEPELTEPELTEPETTEVFHVGEAAEE